MSRIAAAAALLIAAAATAQTEALENPGRISAIQERAFRMNHELTVTAGVLPIDAFYKGLYAQLGYTYHFNDSFAWTVGRGGYSYNLGTGLREQLERDFGVLPTTFDEVNFFVGSDVLWTPFYGKFALLNRWVLHLDFHLIGGASVQKFTQSGFRPGVDLGGGLRVFQNRWVSYRLDVMDTVVVIPKPTNVLSVSLSLALNFGATE